jgi:hypothetical protein
MIKSKKSEVKSLDITTLIIAMSIPSAITGFAFWALERKIARREAEHDKKEAKREEKMERKEEARKMNELLVIKGVNAAIALGEATAKAVQRIPDAHCNGDMHAALEYAAQIKHEQKDFLTKQGVDSIY